MAECKNVFQEYVGIRILAQQGKYTEALAKLNDSQLAESTRVQLVNALDSNDPYVVERTLAELDARIAQALCWSCWRE